MPSSAATTSDSMPIVLYWRARYASAPCWIALEIFCISGVPRLCLSTQRARKTAKSNANALALMTTASSCDCVCVMMRGKWECGGRRSRSGVGGGGALEATPEGEDGDADQHQDEAGHRLGARRRRQQEQHHHAAAQQDVQQRQERVADGPVGPVQIGPLRAQDEQPGGREDVEQQRGEDDVVEELVVGARQAEERRPDG